MSTDFTLTSKTRVDSFKDNVSIGDAITYAFDLTPWQEDNAAVTGVTWTLDRGEATIGTPALAAGIATALIAFTTHGCVLIALLITTATAVKKVWLEILVRDEQNNLVNDYGLYTS